MTEDTVPSNEDELLTRVSSELERAMTESAEVGEAVVGFLEHTHALGEVTAAFLGRKACLGDMATALSAISQERIVLLHGPPADVT